ncbi:MAG TPA: PEPxxWA-CTERM sorting domain-containing protein [Phenylobacterium sp.]|nr:PEPxxWA-CTERM sorting domain-containing protein [Phenylobacterium sp.]
MQFKGIAAAAALGALSLSGAAQAAVMDFTMKGVIESASTPGINAGDVITVHLFADNGGASTISQTWNLADLLGFTIQAGTYSATYSKVWQYPSTGNFQTDASGAVSHVEFYGTDDLSHNVDNFGSWTADSVFGNASFCDFLDRCNNTSGGTFNNASQWTVGLAGPGGVPEPATWAMMIAGFGMAGVAMRRRRAAIAA